MAYGLLTAVADNDTPDSVIELLDSRRSKCPGEYNENARRWPVVARCKQHKEGPATNKVQAFGEATAILCVLETALCALLHSS